MDVLDELDFYPETRAWYRSGATLISPRRITLPAVWFDALRGGVKIEGSAQHYAYRHYSDPARARADALSAWESLPEADRAAIRLARLGLKLGASL